MLFCTVKIWSYLLCCNRQPGHLPTRTAGRAAWTDAGTAWPRGAGRRRSRELTALYRSQRLLRKTVCSHDTVRRLPAVLSLVVADLMQRSRHSKPDVPMARSRPANAGEWWPLMNFVYQIHNTHDPNFLVKIVGHSQCLFLPHLKGSEAGHID